MSPNARGGGCGVSANEYRYSCAHGAQLNFGDLSSVSDPDPYWIRNQVRGSESGIRIRIQEGKNDPHK